MTGQRRSTTECDERLIQSIRREFVEDALEELARWEKLLLDYERSGDPEALSEFERRMHSMKGSAMVLDLGEAGEFLHLLEGRVAKWFPRRTPQRNSRLGGSGNGSEAIGRCLELIDGFRSLYQSLARGEDASVPTQTLRQRLSA